MATKSISTNDALTKKAWEEQLFRDARYETYFNDWTSGGTESIVQLKTNLKKERGDKITFGIRMNATGDGVMDDQPLEGNEEALVTYDSSVTLHQYRHAFRTKRGIDEQRASFSVTEESRTAIKDWGVKKRDTLHFDALNAARTKVFYKTSAGMLFAAPDTAKAALTTTYGKMTLAFLSLVRTWLETGGGGTYVPPRPVKVKGKPYFVALMHPDVLYDLKVTDTNWAQAQREAQARGSENPIFTGSAGIWDGIVLHEHRQCYRDADAGGSANVPWGMVHILGAQSLIVAEGGIGGSRPELVQENFDYKKEVGYGWDMILGVARPEFNSLEYGSVCVYAACTNIAGLS